MVAGGYMILTIDIGNTVIALGIFKENKLVHVFNLDTDNKRSSDLYLADLVMLFRVHQIDPKLTKEAIISSVVPILTSSFVENVTKLCGIEPLIVGRKTKTGLPLRVDNPSELGADLVAVSVGAINKFKSPIIIVDYGTANKFLYIDNNGALAGAIFTPGLTISYEALVNRTAQLPSVSLEKPNNILGKNTKDCLNSGAVYGNVAMISKLCEMIEKEVGFKCSKILTGGNAKYLKDELKDEFIYEENLIHDGLLTILLKTKGESKNEK
jgi:type III pantothenate kinase